MRPSDPKRGVSDSVPSQSDSSSASSASPRVNRSAAFGEPPKFEHHAIPADLPLGNNGVGDYGQTAIADLDKDGHPDFILGRKGSGDDVGPVLVPLRRPGSVGAARGRARDAVGRRAGGDRRGRGRVDRPRDQRARGTGIRASRASRSSRGTSSTSRTRTPTTCWRSISTATGSWTSSPCAGRRATTRPRRGWSGTRSRPTRRSLGAARDRARRSRGDHAQGRGGHRRQRAHRPGRGRHVVRERRRQGTRVDPAQEHPLRPERAVRRLRADVRHRHGRRRPAGGRHLRFGHHPLEDGDPARTPTATAAGGRRSSCRRASITARSTRWRSPISTATAGPTSRATSRRSCCRPAAPTRGGSCGRTWAA